MQFDWTINAGTVVSTVTILIGFIVAHVRGVERLTKIETKVEMMYQKYMRD